jgi:hypothetical protein
MLPKAPLLHGLDMDIGGLLVGDLLQDQAGNARCRVEHGKILQNKSPQDIVYHRNSQVATGEILWYHGFMR